MKRPHFYHLFENKDVCVVGGAQSLFNHQHGKKIDRHEVVCRLNGGAEIVDPAVQGTRNDVWGIGKYWTVQELFKKVTWGYLLHLAPGGTTIRYTKDGDIYDRNKEFIDTGIQHPLIDGIYHEAFHNVLRDNIGKYKMSTGIMFIDGVHRCNPKSITLYGFDWKKTPTWYYPEGRMGYHKWKEEERHIRENYSVRVV